MNETNDICGMLEWEEMKRKFRERIGSGLKRRGSNLIY
jgi:hypothetical protein